MYPAGDSRDAGDRDHNHSAIEDFLIWRKYTLETMGKGTINFLDVTGCTWASAKGVIEVLMSELRRRGFWDATVTWAKEVEPGESGYGGDDNDIVLIMRQRILTFRVVGRFLVLEL